MSECRTVETAEDITSGFANTERGVLSAFTAGALPAFRTACGTIMLEIKIDDGPGKPASGLDGLPTKSIDIC